MTAPHRCEGHTRTVELSLLGAATVRRSSGGITRLSRVTPKPLALLAYLAVADPSRLHRRDKLVALLWPELDEQHARAALRQALHVLRRMLGANVVSTSGANEVGLSPSALTSDVEAFQMAAATGRCDEAVRLFGGPLLEGLLIVGAPGFMEWLEQTRAHHARIYSRCLESLASQYEAMGRWNEAVDWWTRLVGLDRLNVRASAALVRCQAAAGDPAGALNRAEEFTSVMRRETGVDPAPQLQASFAEGCQLGYLANRAEGGSVHHPPNVSSPAAATDNLDWVAILVATLMLAVFVTVAVLTVS